MGRAVVDNQSNHSALNCKFSVKFLHPFDKQITIYPALYFEKDNDKVNFLHHSNNVVWQTFRSQIRVAFSCSITSSQSGKFYLTMTTTTTLNFVFQKLGVLGRRDRIRGHYIYLSACTLTKWLSNRSHSNLLALRRSLLLTQLWKWH